MEGDLADVLRWVRSYPCPTIQTNLTLSRIVQMQFNWNQVFAYNWCYDGDWDTVETYGTFKAIQSVLNSACNMGIGCKDVAYHYRRWKDVGIVRGDIISHVDQLYNASLVSPDYHRRMWHYYVTHDVIFRAGNNVPLYTRMLSESVLAVEDPDFMDDRPASEPWYLALPRKIYVPRDYPVPWLGDPGPIVHQKSYPNLKETRGHRKYHGRATPSV